MRLLFVDTGAFFAYFVRKDRMHDAARDLLVGAYKEKRTIVATNAVVFETHALLVNRAKDRGKAALRFLEAIDRRLIEVERVTPEDEQKAIALVRGHRDKAYSLCDAASFVVMERLGITEAIAFDRHFREYGKFTVV